MHIYYSLLYFCTLIYGYKTCFDETNDINYLFLNDKSQIKIPLIPLNCLHCQLSYQVDIQLIDEQILFGNRTIQRVKIFLKNFEIEDSSYVCLINICPIIVEYGSDSILLNITSSLFSHTFLSLTYINSSIICSIQTRFAIFSLEKSLSCTDKIYLHPRLNVQILRQLNIYDCQAYLFEENVYLKSIKFHQNYFLINTQTTKLKPSNQTCEYTLENIIYINNSSSIKTNQLSTTISLYSFHNPWKKDVEVLGICHTKFIPYREIFFTHDIIHLRTIIIEKGQTIQINCPIDGSEEYLKYVWFYQKYQPRYQISNNRTIILNNVTEQMQGTYICFGDDGNERLEFEMTLTLQNSNKTNNHSYYFMIISILIGCLIIFGIVLTFIICFLLKHYSPLTKRKSLVIHHDVLLSIQHSTNSLWNQPPYHTLNYIDEPPIYSLPSKQLMLMSSQSLKNPISKNIKQRNLNGQSPTLVKSNSDTALPLLLKIHQLSHSINNSINEQLNRYRLIRQKHSFNSQNELEEFNQMSFVCLDN